jgi:hypothetical protein
LLKILLNTTNLEAISNKAETFFDGNHSSQIGMTKKFRLNYLSLKKNPLHIKLGAK